MYWLSRFAAPQFIRIIYHDHFFHSLIDNPKKTVYTI